MLLPNIEEIFDDLVDSKVFTTPNVFSWYWNIKMNECSEKFTTFFTRSGTYQFQFMPFGLTNAPATFQSTIYGIL